jgi:hypothetical protein
VLQKESCTDGKEFCTGLAERFLALLMIDPIKEFLKAPGEVIKLLSKAIESPPRLPWR